MTLKRLRFNAFGGIAPALAALAALTLTFGAAKPASAQAQDFPAVAIVDFEVNTSKVGSPELGKQAAAAVRAEFARLGTADIVPIETVNRTIGEMGWEKAPGDRAGLIRLGQNLNVNTIITGNVIEARVDQVGGGRQARILVAIEVRDVASGLVVNGAWAIGNSGVRTGDVAEASMMGDAINDMAFSTVRDMAGRQLPSATVLNTLPNQALINKGSRSGFKSGMQVIIVRGKDQVGSATVGSVDPDSSFINFGQLIKGVQPGDKVRTLYTPERTPLGIASSGQVRTSRAARGGSNSGLVSLLLVVLALAFLLGQGRGGDSNLASITTQATMTPADFAGVQIKWTRDAFLRGNSEGPYRWQVWRNDGSTSPVAVAEGTAGSTVDDSFGTNAPTAANPWYDFSGVDTNTQCNDLPGGGAATINPMVPGTPYVYSVEVVFRVSGLSLPGEGGTGGGGGTTGGLTTGGGGTTTGGGTGGLTTGGGGTTTTTGGGTTGGGGQTSEWCYFISKRLQAKGQATPLVRPELRSPDPDQIVMTPFTFQFASVRGPVGSVPLEYVVQFSTSLTFPKGAQTVTTTPFLELTAASGDSVSSPTIDTTTFFPGALDVFWRVGVRNPSDVPGPVADANGQRFIWSAVRRFKRSPIPPAPKGGG